MSDPIISTAASSIVTTVETAFQTEKKSLIAKIKPYLTHILAFVVGVLTRLI